MPGSQDSWAFAAGANVSTNAIDMGGHALIALDMGDWTAADITFDACATEDGTYKPVRDDAKNEIVVQLDGNTWVGITGTKADALSSARWLKLRSGLHGSEVSQVAATTIGAVMKGWKQYGSSVL